MRLANRYTFPKGNIIDCVIGQCMEVLEIGMYGRDTFWNGNIKGFDYRAGIHSVREILEIGLQCRDKFCNGNLRDWVSG